MTKRQKWLLAATALVVEVPLAVRAWQDLDRRTDEQVRGKKSLWRVLVIINPGNSVIYWLAGRR